LFECLPRTKQLSEEMSVPKEILEGLGGREGFNMGGGGSNNELTNWDGTKRKTGWGR